MPGLNVCTPIPPLDLVHPHLEARAPIPALVELCGRLGAASGVLDEARFLNELLERHALGTNCLDQQIALAHLRTSAVKRIVLGVGRSENGMHFSPQFPAIRLIFVIGVPLADTGEYLRVVSQLVRTIRQPFVRESLLRAETPEELTEALRSG